jgi:hypothetical protein
MAGYIYNKMGEPVGYTIGNFVYKLNGTPVGHLNGTHVHKLSGEYVGEIYHDMVVDKSMIVGKLKDPKAPGRPGAPRNPGKRVPIKPPYPDIFNKLGPEEVT